MAEDCKVAALVEALVRREEEVVVPGDQFSLLLRIFLLVVASRRLEALVVPQLVAPENVEEPEGLAAFV